MIYFFWIRYYYLGPWDGWTYIDLSLALGGRLNQYRCASGLGIGKACVSKLGETINLGLGVGPGIDVS